MTISIVTFIGARPQFIKASVVSRAMAALSRGGGPVLDEIVIHSGQHYDANMSEVFFREMGIPAPDYMFDAPDRGRAANAGRMVRDLKILLERIRPRAVMVYGDTNTTLAGALAAFALGLPVAHVEAGLRSFNPDMPEESNRVRTDRISDFLFCPTSGAVDNLAAEGLGNTPGRPGDGCFRSVEMVGDVMFDAALHFADRSRPGPDLEEAGDVLGGDFALATVHRAGNTDDPANLAGIVEGLSRVARDMPVVLPLHPRTARAMKGLPMGFGPGVRVLPPLGYLDMLYLLGRCRVVLTDSGGLQKEAYFFKAPCVTMRRETEWRELVDAGCNVLVGADPVAIHGAFAALMDADMDFSGRPYGDGRASQRIASVLAEGLAETLS